MTRRTWWLLAAAIAGLALVASANSVTNGFAYDDVFLIQRTPRLHTMDGWWRDFGHTYWPEDVGGEGYRPLTIIAYRIEWALGAGSPLAFHVTNIALHVFGAVAVFWLACAVLPLAAAWIAAALYAVHPVHVEAIANVVGQSELAVALLLALAAGLYLHGRQAGPLSRGRWVAIAALYASACLFKEHGIVLPALLLLAEFTVVGDRAPLNERVARLRTPMLALAAIGVAFLWARTAVVVAGLSGFKPYAVFQALELSTPQRILTMVGAAPEWLRLFLWPQRLMTEYAPAYIDVAQSISVAQLPGLLVLLGTLGLLIVCWRRSPVTAFGLGWLVLTLLPASNFLIPAGFIIAERTLLSPSIGAMIAVGSTIPYLYARLETSTAGRRLAALAVVVLLSLGIGRSVTRNRAWFSNETLFRQGVIDSPDSYRAHFMLGAHLFENARKTEGERHYREALRLFPYDAMMSLALAEQYRKVGLCEPAIPLYRALFALEPNAAEGHLGFASCLLVTYHLEEAKQEALAGMRSGAKLNLARDIIKAADQADDSLAARRSAGTKAPVPIPFTRRPP